MKKETHIWQTRKGARRVQKHTRFQAVPDGVFLGTGTINGRQVFLISSNKVACLPYVELP